MPLITGTTYGLTGLRANTLYSVEVKAVDTSGNEGPGVTNSFTTPQVTYSDLNAQELLIDYSGLVVGTDNAYGVVDASGNVTKLRSIAPSVVREFNWTGTGNATLTSEGILFPGTGRFVSADTAATWSFLHNATTPYTIRFAGRLGNSADPNAMYGIFGTNATAASKIGAHLSYDDRVAVPNNELLTHYVTNGGGVSTGIVYRTNAISQLLPNALSVFSQEASFSPKTVSLRVNNVAKTATIDASSTATATASAPTHTLEIGAAGNGVVPFVGLIKQLGITKSIDEPNTRADFDLWLMGRAGL